MISLPLPALDDAEMERVPDGLEVIDAHVHLFPDRVFDAIWGWFGKNSWPVRYKLYAPQVVEFLLQRGVSNIVALHYAHKPGMAAALNRYMQESWSGKPGVVPLATVLPGEPGAAEVLQNAFESGLRGVKLHCHVQCFSPDDASMDEVYRTCVEYDRPLVMHAGRQPWSSAYACDPYEMCGVERVQRARERFPGLRLCIPHFGADEMEGYIRLCDRYDSLMLDTTMMMADYFPDIDPSPILKLNPDRIMYGTDFPNIPYAWSRELQRILAQELSTADRAKILSGNARRFFGIDG